MTSMTRITVGVTGGVDTHGHSHHAAVIDHLGRQLGDRAFPASPVGYRALVEWLQSHGVVDRVGVEGTGTYGVGLTRHFREAGALVVEVDRPDRRARRAQGKSDPPRCLFAARATGHQDRAAPTRTSPPAAIRRKSPRLTMSLINWSTGSLQRCSPFLALDPRSPARCSPVPATTRTDHLRSRHRAPLRRRADPRQQRTHPPAPP